MASPHGMLQAAIDRLIVHAGGARWPEGTTWRDMRDWYGSSAAAADNLGYPHGQPGSPAWHARRNFMRNFQGAKLDRKVSAPLRERVRLGILPGPRNRREVITGIANRGIIVLGLNATITVSKDTNRPRVDPNRFIPAGNLHDAGFFPDAYNNDWKKAAVGFFNAWATAYGIGIAVVMDEVDSLDLQLPD